MSQPSGGVATGQSALGIVLRTPVFRMLAGVIGLIGVFNAAVYPYQSLIGIERLGLTEPQFALVMVLASVSGVSATVLIGILADQKANRRRMALISAAIGLGGGAMMLMLPTAAIFAVAHGVLIPVAGSLFSQAFALNRLASANLPGHREGVQAAIRAAMSATFLVMLVLLNVAMTSGLDVMAVYAIGTLASVALVALIWLQWPRDGETHWQDAPSGLRLSQALAEMARPRVALRVLCLGAVMSSGILYMVLVSLVFEAAEGRGTADVALYVGLVAGWEVPAMLMLPRLVAHLPRARVLVAGTAIYIGHLVFLPVLAESAWVWALTIAAGIGGTAMLIIPLTYYQDLMQGRPGTAASLMAVQKLVGDVMAAAAFAIGTAIGGYGLTAAIGGTIAMIGALGLWLADRKRPV